MSAGIVVNKLTTDGRGLAFIDGKATFIKNALPGETVNIKYIKQKRQYDEAEATEIIKASPERVEPKCQVFGICGGCSLQHLNPSAQIYYKELWLKEMLTQAGLQPKAWLAPLQAEVWGYRQKARLGVRFVRKKDEVLVGFREAMSNFITNTTRCEILNPLIGTHLQALKEVLTTLSIKEHIAQIEVAGSNEGVALVFRHLVPMPEADLAKIIALAKQYHWLIYLQSGGLDTITQVYPEEQVELSYTLFCHPRAGGDPQTDTQNFMDPRLRGDETLQFRFRPQDFTQVNLSLNAAMVAQALVLLELKPEDTVLDLFCGLGNFTLPLALKSKQVQGLEGDAYMTELAAHNAQKNKITNARFALANLFEVEALKPFTGKVDKLLLDPPRVGAEAVVRNIHLWQPERILYVSCHPATLVRDLTILVNEQGYILEKIGVMDMFPHTNHVEAMALLIKK
jgi:23S rRNA (uracil1939-C5)-methyltransferase